VFFVADSAGRARHLRALRGESKDGACRFAMASRGREYLGA